MADHGAFIVIDLEGTSREASESHIVEWAAIVIEPHWFGEREHTKTIGGLIRPPIFIPPETSAVHHIIDSDVADAPTWKEDCHRLREQFSKYGDGQAIAVAHNSKYESTVLADYLSVKWICTYKAALRVWPEAPSHSNESLRYWLKLPGIGRGCGQQAPHSAAHDAIVTAQILVELLKITSVEDLLTWTEEPALLPTCPIGDWRGQPWADIDDGFLNWILKKSETMREDVVFCARKELDRRHNEYLEQQAAAKRKSDPAVDDDIPF